MRNIKQMMKRLAAVLMVGAAMLAPGNAWASGYKFVGTSQVNDLDGPGTLINWQCEYGVSDAPGFCTWTPVKDGPFEIYRDGVYIATVTNTDVYRDLDTVGGNVYSYVIKGHGLEASAVSKRCYCSYHPLIDKPTVEVDNSGGTDSIQVSVQKKHWTQMWYSPEGSSLGSEHLVESLVRCSASSDSDWLVLTGADESGNAIHDGEGEMSFVVAPNMTDSERIAKISIRASSENWLTLTNIVVTQAPGPAGFAVHFDACGGTGDTSMRVCQDGEALGELPEVKLDGCVFLGWFTEAEGGEAVGADTVVTGDATYYAHWIRLGESRQFVDVGGLVWKYQVLNRGTAEHPDLYVKIIGDGNYPVSGGRIVETGAIDKSTAGELEIPSSLEGYPVRVIGQWAFAYCRNLTKAAIPDSVDTIEDCAFASCSGMESVHFGANVTTIGGGAFLYCRALKTLTLPESVTTLGASAFGGCESLRRLRAECKISSGCHIVMGYWIGGMMFNLVGNGIDMDPLWDCTGLACIELGANVTEVYLDGFGNGPNLRSVICRGMLPTISGGNTAYGRTICYVLRENYPDGLPAETWAGMELRYLDGDGPSESSEVDFYVAGAFLASSASDVEERTSFKVGEPVLLSYTMSERWNISGMETQVVNRITVRRGSDDSVVGYEDDLVAEVTGGTSVERKGMGLDCLKGLPEGSYSLLINLNTVDAAAETDYANNSTSITFTVVGTPKYTVAFDLNGAPGAVPVSRTVSEGNAVGELPEVTWSGHTFVGWFVGDTQISEATPVVADMVCTAKWQSFDIIYWKPLNMTWKETMFVNASSSANEMQTTFKVGDPIYFYYACYEADAQSVRTSFVNRFTLTGDNGVSKDDLYQEISGISSGTCEGVYGVKVDAFQNLAPGTYTLACTLDADGNVLESDEDNNTQSITFTVVSKDPINYTVTFNANGGTVSPTTRTVASGTAVGTLPTATKKGYKFDGWYTAASGGTKINATTKVTANVTYYAHWANYVRGDPMPVKIRIGDKESDVTVTVGDVWGESLPSAPAPAPGYTFVGWFTGEAGTGTQVTAATVVSTATQDLYAYYVKDDDSEVYFLYEPGAVQGAAPTVASTYDGYLYRDNAVVGTIQIKVGKPGKDGTAAVKATVIGLDGKKKNLKAEAKGKAAIAANGPTEVVLVGGDACVVTLGTQGMSGKYGSYDIDGGLNVFMSKDAADKAVAEAVLGKWQGVVNVAWEGAQGWNGLAVSIAAKGKAKVSGTLADGAKVSVNSQLIVGEKWCCVPVLYVKKGVSLAFGLWLPRSGEAAAVTGLASAIAGKPGTLKAGAAFQIDVDALAARLGQRVLPYLPNGLPVTVSGGKWTLPKAGKVAYKKGTSEPDEAKLGENPSELKLTYAAKSGTFKGSFKVYVDVGGKPKATAVNVAGVLVDGTGYGAATIKKAGGVGVMIKEE